MSTTTFQGGPLDPASPPRKFIQVLARNGPDEPHETDQYDPSVVHGSYELKLAGTELIYVWKGAR